MNVVDEFYVNPVRHLWENRRFLRNLVNYILLYTIVPIFTNYRISSFAQFSRVFTSLPSFAEFLQVPLVIFHKF